MTPRSGPAWSLPALSVSAALTLFGVVQYMAWVQAGGHFDYPIDDPYIHLAIAEQIAQGGYGVNAGEIVGAASSPLYPLLLTPFADAPVQRFLPLAWNVIGLALAAGLWGRIVWLGFGAGIAGALFAVLPPLALNMEGLAFNGMEHILHAAASLSIVLGLVTLADEKRLGAALILGVFFAPLLRLEGVALALLAAGAVVLTGRIRAGLGLLALAVLPLAVFAGILLALGLDPVPGSVQVKLGTPPDVPLDSVAAFLDEKVVRPLMEERREQILAMLILLCGVFLLFPAIRKSPRRIVLFVVAGAGLAHFLFGRFGWIDRYEGYAMLTVAAGLMALAPLAASRIPTVATIVPFAVAANLYVPLFLFLYPTAPNALYLQQGQMARFAREYLKAPVAVNDVGYVAWHNPNYVLDVWGLANEEARRIRLEEGRPPGWIGGIAARNGIPFAMVYDQWFHDELGADWRLLGQLRTEVPHPYLGGDLVNFFLTDPDEDPAPYLRMMEAWARDLPPGASFAFTKAEVGA